MKNTIYTLALCCILPLACIAQWQQTGGPQGGTTYCMARVGAQIWTGTFSGIYTSDNEGLTWQKSPLLTNTPCTGMFATGDTIVLLYYEETTFDYLTYSITSFNNGVTWGTPKEIGSSGNGITTTKVSRVQNTLVCDKSVSYNWGGSWSSLDPVPGGSIFNQALNSKNMMVTILNYSSYFRSLYISKDGLHTWELIDSAQILGEIYMDESLILMIINSYDTTVPSKLLRSVNLGLSWDTVFYTPLKHSMHSPFGYNNAIYVYAQSPDGDYWYYKTTDNGNTWTTVPFRTFNYANYLTLTNGDLLGVAYSNGIMRYIPALDTFYYTNTGIKSQKITTLKANKNVLFTAGEDDFYRSADAGQTWQPMGLDLGNGADMVFMGDTIFAVGESFFMRSFNNGLTWDTTMLGYGGDYSTIDRIGDTIFISQDNFYYTTDYGTTLDTLPLLTSSYDRVGCIRVLDNDLFAVSEGGVIYKYNFVAAQWDSISNFWSPGAHLGNILYRVNTALVMAGRDELIISTDHGLTWVNSPLTGLPVDGFGDPAIPRNIIYQNGLWIGECGYSGVYVSYDNGQSWQTMDSGTPPFIAWGGLTIFNDVLFAAGYYSSVWRRAGSFSTISGRVFHDMNNNTVQDNGEPGFSNAIVSVQPSGVTVTTDTVGNYSVYTDVSGDSLKPVFPVFFGSSIPGFYITNGAATNRDFAIQIPSNIADLTVDVTNTNVFRSGFGTNLVVTALNKGSLSQNAQVELVLDSNLQFISASPAPASTSGDTMRWNTGTLNLLQTALINVTVQAHLGLQLNTVVSCKAFITPVNNDTLPLDNYAVLKEPVVGSFDPNDKACNLGNIISPEQVKNGQEMQFTVRFQNTGNFQADFINIADTLSEYFDLNTFRIISSSHTMRYTINNNAVNFNFPDIFLPPSSQDEPGSHGFVKYGVRCKKTMVLGNAVVNTAYIYFDFNPAIITNTTATLVAIPLSINEPGNITGGKDIAVKVYPNPTRDILNVDLSEIKTQGLSIAIYDVNGTLIRTEKPADTISSINMQNFANGIYLGRISDAWGNALGAFRFVLNK